MQKLYSECLRRIFKWNMFRKFGPGEKANIDQMRNLAKYFGNPQDTFKSIHVAGTNGKGTVTIKTARTLEHAGFRTGLFISPHISTFRERITVNQEMISQEELVKYAQMIFDAIDKQGFDVTFFEIVTMIAFLQFADKKVDYAVLECGMGGRLDATNVIQRPEACAITSIGYDHMEVLGSTLELIAAEKAGIIKQGVPCVIGPTVVQDAVFMKAKEMDAKLIQVTRKNYRKANAEIVEHLLECLGIQIEPASKTHGLKAEQPCRLERVPDSQVTALIKGESYPDIYLDVCHNPQAVESVIKELMRVHPMSSIFVVCGFSKQKDMTSMLHHLATSPNVIAIHPVTSPHFKLQNIDAVRTKFDEVSKLLHPYIDHAKNPLKEPIGEGDIKQTLQQITEQAAAKKDVVLVCGSFYIMSDVRNFYNFLDEYDPKEVNIN